MKTTHRFPLCASLVALSVSATIGRSAESGQPSAEANSTTAPSPVEGGDVFDVSKLDRAPQATFQARPQYPFEMRRAGTPGEVVVDFIVTTKGDVVNAFAIRSSKKEFEAAAVAAVSQWKFKPGQKGGRPVNTHMQVPIVFTLNRK